MKKRKRIIISVILLLLAGIAALLLMKSRKNNKTNATESVKSAEVCLDTISEDIDGSGNLEAAVSRSITIPVGVTIEEIYVESGDTVSKGQKLAKIKKVSIVSALVDIESSLEDVEDKLEEDDLTELELEELKAQRTELQTAQKKLKTWKKNPIIVASCDGIINQIMISEGTEVSKTSSSNTSSDGNEGDKISASYQSVSEEGKITATKMSLTITPETGMIRYISTADLSEENTAEDKKETSEETTTQADSTAAEATTEATTEAATEAARTESPKEESTQPATEEKENNTTQSTTESKAIQSADQVEQNTQSTDKSKKQPSNQQQSSQLPSNNSTKKTTVPSGNQNAGQTNTNTTASTNSTGNTSNLYDAYETEAFTIYSLDTVNVSISVDELDILSVEKGQSATITLDAVPGENFEGVIKKVATVSSSTSGNAKYTVDIELPMTEEMRLGMTASAVIHINQAANVPVIPMIALQEERDTTFVYTSQESDGSLSGKVEVVTGLSDGSKVQIISGLAEGDTVYYTRNAKSDSEENGRKNGILGGNKMPGNGMMPDGGKQFDGETPPSDRNGQRPQ